MTDWRDELRDDDSDLIARALRLWARLARERCELEREPYDEETRELLAWIGRATHLAAVLDEEKVAQ